VVKQKRENDVVEEVELIRQVRRKSNCCREQWEREVEGIEMEDEKGEKENEVLEILRVR